MAKGRRCRVYLRLTACVEAGVAVVQVGGCGGTGSERAQHDGGRVEHGEKMCGWRVSARSWIVLQVVGRKAVVWVINEWLEVTSKTGVNE